MGVSGDSVEKNNAFANKYDFSYNLLCDVDGSIRKAYSPGEGSRYTYVIDTNGKIQNIYPKAKAKGHAQEVLQELK